jgi:phospholipid transport system substrate-binding protein
MPTRRLFPALAFLLALPCALAAPPAAAPARAEQATDQAVAQTAAATGLIRSLVTEVVDALNQQNLRQDQKIAGFRSMLERYFDVPAIGRSVLGRYWLVAAPDQQKEYLTLFEQMIVKVYADRFSQYSGRGLTIEHALKIVGTQPGGEGETIVASQILRADGPPVNVHWRVRARGGRNAIVDVAVEGVSMMATQRQEYASVIQRNGGQVEGLLQALRQQIAQN